MPAAQTEHRRDTHDDGVNAADEKTMLKFAQTWQPCGGADEQILSEFVVTEASYYVKLRQYDPPLVPRLGLRKFRRICTCGLNEHSVERDVLGRLHELRRPSHSKDPCASRRSLSRRCSRSRD